jgi:nucleoside-diphosphate-sugar epimerase
MKTVLLTGASGFIGRHCIELLHHKGFGVHAVTSRDTRNFVNANDNVKWHQINLLDPAGVSGFMKTYKPTHLLHFAWYTEHGKYWNAAENLDWVTASLHLFREFYSNGGVRATGVGSCAEYDWTFGYCDEETTPLKPESLYGKSKKAVFDLISDFTIRSGLSFAWGRLFFVYGPHEAESRLFAYVINSLLRGEVAKCSHGKQIRDFTFVEDVARAFTDILDSDLQGAVNIASGRPFQLQEIISTIGNKLGRNELIEFGEYDPGENETPIVLGGLRRLQGELQWKPDFDLINGIEKSIEWWKNQNDMNHR